MWRRRISTGTRWGTTLASVVIGVVWAANGWWILNWPVGGELLYRRVLVSSGGVEVIWHPEIMLGIDRLGPDPYPIVFRVQPGLAATKRWVPSFQEGGGGFSCFIPLYLPLLLTLAPAAFLWRREIRRRRARVGVCSGCGYDRAGLAPTSKCPECGRG